jgi:predicted ester cyclase
MAQRVEWINRLGSGTLGALGWLYALYGPVYATSGGGHASVSQTSLNPTSIVFFVVMLLCGEQITREQWRDLLSRWATGLPDTRYHVDQLVAEGDVVAANARFTATHRGVFHYRRRGPWAPTSNPVETRVMLFFRLAAGKVVEVRAAWDATAFAQQLGGGPSPATTTT